MRRLTARTTALIALGIAALMLFVSIGIGLRVPSETALDPFGEAGSLDYRALRFGRFEPLRGDFIERELGSVIATGSASGRAAARPAAVRDVVEALAEPIVVAHGFTNDDFSNAYMVSSIPFTAQTNTGGATRQSGEPTSCTSLGGTAWYRYRATRRIGLLANTYGSSYGTALGVYTGTAPGNLRRIGCNSDTSGFSQVAFPAQPGETYWFQIAGPLGGGNLVFNLTLQGVTTLASAASSGTQGDADSILPTISADGRFVSFYSGSTTFTPDSPPPDPCVPNAFFDACRPGVFLRDRRTHHIDRVDVTQPGPPFQSANPTSDQVSITGSLSADGRYVAFWSGHTTLVPNDTNEVYDVFVRDHHTGRVRRVSVSSTGEQADRVSFNASISADGRYVAFTSSADNLVPGDMNVAPDAFLHDIRTGKTTRVSVNSRGEEGNAQRSQGSLLESGSHLIALSTNARFVLFRSTASNLVEDDTNNVADVFLHDLLKGRTTRVSVSSTEEQADADSRQPVGIAQASVSNDGRYVFFGSDATNLVRNDNNGLEDLFVRDTVRGITERVSVSSTGAEANRGVGAQDPFALFVALTTNAFVEPQNSSQVAYSATPDGRFVAFSSDATNLVPGDLNDTTDVFLRDMRTGKTTLLSLASTGDQSNGASNSPVLSADGRFVSYRSAATNLVPGDTNGAEDVFVYEIPGAHELSGWH